MSKPDLDAILSRAEVATPGPWYTFGLPWFPDDLGVLAGSSDPHTGTFIADLSPMDALDDENGKWAQNPADAEFIAHARTDVPALVAELRAAREGLAHWEAVARSHQEDAIHAYYMDAELRAAREVIELGRKAITSARALIGDMPDVHVREPCYCSPQAHPTASAFAAFEMAYEKVTGESQ